MKDKIYLQIKYLLNYKEYLYSIKDIPKNENKEQWQEMTRKKWNFYIEKKRIVLKNPDFEKTYREILNETNDPNNDQLHQQRENVTKETL